MKIKKPIIITGTGRCGSTLLYEIFAHHPDVMFISNLNLKHPESKFLWRFNTIFNKLAYKKGFLKPSEAYPLFNKIFPGYARPCRTLKEFDVTTNINKKFHQFIKTILKYGKKERFLYKLTGWSRIRFFNEIFPDALFINIIRDGRAFANSIIQVPWWEGWNGPQNWRWGELAEEYKKEWENSEKSYIVLAGIQWKLLLDELEESRKFLDENRFLQVRYENLIQDPTATFEEILKFSDLPFPEKFRKKIQDKKFHNYNYKWKKNLPKREREKLNMILSEHLSKYGYR